MLDLAKLDQLIAAVGEDGMHVTKAVLVEFADELRIGNAARLMLAANLVTAQVCASIIKASDDNPSRVSPGIVH